ncbi:MAG TPA: threo-3-hydroxy-L-aspartate ammonia-lyase [Burkholderiales bacterium]|nr:threo-3-hydroxy-L-aspartate ammonia-lyase [Burkholderiales bacterium]
MEVTYEDLAAAHERIKPYAKKTPVLTSSTVDALTGAKVHFKCENFQRMGAFKFRGAYNALSQLIPEQKKQGVVAFSSGNHAQAVALSGRMLGIPATIVMPTDAPKVKLEATRGYGAEVVLYDASNEDRAKIAEKLAAERGLTVIPPFDHPHILAGQGTAAKELIEQTGQLDILMVPCGGGGLLSGCSIAAKHLSPQCRVIGVEPAAGDDGLRSFRSGKLESVPLPMTIADGARTMCLGKLTFSIIQRNVHDFLTVTDEELLEWMFFLWERMKMVVEPTGALAAAALLQGKIDTKGKKVGVVISGGNVDLAWAARRRLAQPAP